MSCPDFLPPRPALSVPIDRPVIDLTWLRYLAEELSILEDETMQILYGEDDG